MSPIVLGSLGNLKQSDSIYIQEVVASLVGSNSKCFSGGCETPTSRITTSWSEDRLHSDEVLIVSQVPRRVGRDLRSSNWRRSVTQSRTAPVLRFRLSSSLSMSGFPSAFTTKKSVQLCRVWLQPELAGEPSRSNAARASGGMPFRRLGIGVVKVRRDIFLQSEYKLMVPTRSDKQDVSEAI